MGTCFLTDNSEINRFGSYYELDMDSVHRLLTCYNVACQQVAGDTALILA